MSSDKLTNEQVGAISRAHYCLKQVHQASDALARFNELTGMSDNDITYAIKELEKVFTWLNIYQAAHKEDE